METKTLTLDTLKNQISEYCSKHPVSIEWDYRDKLDKNAICDILQSEDGIFNLENDLFERNLDYISELENYFVKDSLLPLFEDDLIHFNIDDPEQFLRDFIIIDMNIKYLLNNTGDILCFIPLYSNYDCTNSFDTLKSSDYLKQVYNRVKKGVNKNDFIFEHSNGAYGGSLFGFIFSASLEDVIELKTQLKTGKKILIPSGTQFGFFSSFQGAGSCFDKTTFCDMYINIKETGKNYSPEYDKTDIIADCELSYSFKDVYGCSSDFANYQTIKVI